jgi:hypothetical protein
MAITCPSHLFFCKFLLPVQIPPLVHAVDLQMQVNVGSLNDESEPLHPVQIVALVQPVQFVLHAIYILKRKKYFY